MSYTPHTWVDDESITYDKLNNIEAGIGEASNSSSVELVPFHWDSAGTSLVLDKTAQELYDGFSNGTLFLLKLEEGDYDGFSSTKGIFLMDYINVGYGNDEESSKQIDFVGGYTFSANSMSDYPSAYLGD